MSAILEQMLSNKEQIYSIIGILQEYGVRLPSYNNNDKKYKTLYNLADEVVTQHVNSTPVNQKVDIKVPDNSMKMRVKKPEKVENVNTKQRETNKSDAKECSSIADIRTCLEKSTFCDIKTLAQNTVLSDGKSDARVVLIGEAPGETEDVQGIPFCGRSGKLLDNILKSVNLDRNVNLYITNSVFWRPPANRKPTEDEIALCRPFLIRQLELIKPKLVILCGGTAIESFFQKKDVKVGELVGKISENTEILDEKLLVTAIYHPSYLLRNPSAKKVAWLNLLKIKSIIDDLI